MDRNKYYNLIFQAIFIYTFLAVIFIFLKDIFSGINSSLFMVFSILIVIYFVIFVYFIWNKKFLPLFSVETAIVKEKDVLSSQVSKLKKENSNFRDKVSSLESENSILKEKIESSEKRLKGEYKFAFYYNSEEEERLTHKIREMLENSKGKQIRIISLLDGHFKEHLIDSLKDGNLKVLIRKIGTSNNIQPFCEKLNELGKERGWVCKHNETIHGRMIIVGNEEMVVMTCDVLRDMCDKMDFGIWTRDPVLISEGIKLFDKIYTSKGTSDYFAKSKK